MVKALVIGKGAREHALIWKLKQSEYVDKVLAIPGNCGIKQIAECIDYKVEDFDGIVDFCKNQSIDIVLIGPEDPLCNGLVNRLQEAEIKAFGPTKEAAKIEGSKVWAKNFMKKYEIPTAGFEIFSDPKKAKDYVQDIGTPIVVKADGLATGKGSIVCMTRKEADNAIDLIMVQKKFNDAGNKIVIEEYLEGEEATVLALSDGKTVRPLVSSQDHKPVFENPYDKENWLATGGDISYKYASKGPNTGGMGAIAPAPVVTKEVMKQVYEEILVPTIQHLREEGSQFKGCLYAGLMIKDNKAKVVEFNVRFGDPEASVVLPLLDVDFYSLIKACIEENLEKFNIINKPGSAAAVVMASGGYPVKYEKGKIIRGLEYIPIDIHVFHAGTKLSSNDIITDGGRVLDVTALGLTLEDAIRRAYEGVRMIYFAYEYNRTDIGKHATKR